MEFTKFLGSLSKQVAGSSHLNVDSARPKHCSGNGFCGVIPKSKIAGTEVFEESGSPRGAIRSTVSAITLAMLTSGVFLGSVADARADAMDQARRIHQRLTGVSPSATVLDAMVAKINANDALGAAFDAMNDPSFCNVLLKNWVMPWSNEEFDPTTPLNDYVATVVGIIRDDIPFNQVLTGDIIYLGDVNDYSHTDNDHYEQMERNGVNLCDPTQLIQTTQSGLPGSVLPASATAGVMTTRQAAAAFFSGGTNRLMWRKTAIHYLCRDMEDLKDFSRPSDRVRQDVSRSPGGDSTAFRQHCVGCHSGMDAVTGAFAYYSFDEDEERLVYTPNQVQEKYLINEDAFPLGYVTTGDDWLNYWRQGRYSMLGWDATLPGAGSGAKSLGQEVAASRGFATCQVQKVFEQVCFRPPETGADMAAAEQFATSFQQGYSMKSLMAQTAIYCSGN